MTGLLVGLPLFGAAVLLLGGRRTNSWGHLLGVLASVASFGVGAGLFIQMLGRKGPARVVDTHLYSWEKLV